MKAVGPIELPHHVITVVPEERKVITVLSDGSEAHACPYDTPEYRAHAVRSGVGEDVDMYCFQHDLAHVVFGEMLGGESPVLRHVASATAVPQDQLDREEEIVKLLQTYWNLYGWPYHLKGVM